MFNVCAQCALRLKHVHRHKDVYNTACATYCLQCNSAGAGLCDSGQCQQNYTVADDKTCQGQSVSFTHYKLQQ